MVSNSNQHESDTYIDWNSIQIIIIIIIIHWFEPSSKGWI